MRIDRRWALAALLLLGCDDESTATPGAEDPPCDLETNGFEYCQENGIIWCHAGGSDIPDPHFHQGRNCDGEGLVCLEGQDNLGYCGAAEDTCSDGAPGECIDGDAVNCIDGLKGTRRCIVGKECQVLDGWATCVQL